MLQPVDQMLWVPVEKLDPNDYNPNVVFNQELKLLEFSLLKTGWIQPLLVAKNPVEGAKQYLIIDGYHRWWLTKNSQPVWDMTMGRVPVVVMDLAEPERMMLTIRINRAKGSHVALKMSDIIKRLVQEYGVPAQVICEQIGAPKDEVELLLMEDVFEAKDIQNHKYSKAWVPA
jgi:ParB-like chromosome segregation protein Spo0J